MQIVYICGYNKSASGGVQNIFPEYVRHMSSCAKVLVLNLGGASIKTYENVQVINSEKKLFCYKETISLAVFHEVYYLRYYSLARKLHARQIPYVVIPHGSFTKGAQSQKKYAKKIFNLFWVDRFVQKAVAIQFLSEGEQAASVYGQKRHFIIPNGINITERHKVFTRQKDEMKLIFIGRLSIFYKGLDLLLGACRRIQDEMVKKHIFLDIYGTDFENGRKQLAEMIREQKLENCVALHDGVFGSRKEEVLLQHDVFIQTSRYEGQPVGILEAMQYGMPLIVTYGTTFGAVAAEGQCGWLVEENEQSIADGILKAYTQREKWDIFCRNARNLAINHYSWESVKRKTIQEYQKYGYCKNSSNADNL